MFPCCCLSMEVELDQGPQSLKFDLGQLGWGWSSLGWGWSSLGNLGELSQPGIQSCHLSWGISPPLNIGVLCLWILFQFILRGQACPVPWAVDQTLLGSWSCIPRAVGRDGHQESCSCPLAGIPYPTRPWQVGLGGKLGLSLPCPACSPLIPETVDGNLLGKAPFSMQLFGFAGGLGLAVVTS